MDNKKYLAHIYAESFEDADNVVIMRNLKEKVLGKSGIIKDGYGNTITEEILNPDFKDLTDYEFMFQLPKILHTACYLCMIGYFSKRVHPINILGDNGILHELIHLLNGTDITTRRIRRVRGKFMQLQQIISEHYK